MTLPVTFAWVNETDTTFNAGTMDVLNEEIVSFEVKHDEGQIPTLDMVVRNPRIGLLNPGRKVWGWLAYRNGSNTLVPIFFGVLVGVPTSLFQEKVTLKLIARSPQFIAHKQALAETMKTAPYYDPIWLETSRRDDPDGILEGWSALWHIDRTTLNISASDVLNGEDGTVTYTQAMAVYNSVSLTLGQPPLTNIRVEATVNWTQRTSGYFDVPQVNISSYTGESLLSDWPKPGGDIGGGYKCESSFVTDTYRISQTPTTNWNMSWTNTDPNPGQCSNASASTSSSGPALLAPNPLTNVTAGYIQSGICDPFSDPPLNRPMSLSSSGVVVPLWNVGLKMTVRYDMSRQFSEILSFDMIANTQSILASPTVSQNTELLTLSSVDVGQPLLDLNAWTNFAGQPVGLAQVIWPNNPTKPGGLAFQICVQAGTAGVVEPVFSDIVGFTTNDNTVVWASMGTSALTNAPRWSPATFVPRGQITLMQNQTFNINTGQFENVPGATSYYLCTSEGYTNARYRDFSYTPPPTSNVQATEAVRHISTIDPPAFSGVKGQHITDGGVTWTVLGKTPDMLGIPIGGSPDDVAANCFFPLARGERAAQYVLCKARARLRWRSRAVNVGWVARFDDVVGLSCRKNATLLDPRLPGGSATGKVISYSLIMGGDGKIYGKVEIGCAIGFGDSISPVAGTPVYAAAGYAQNQVGQPSYQVYDGAMVALGSNDIAYSKPVYRQFDDGLRLPLRWADVSDGGRLSGTLDQQAEAIKASFLVAIRLKYEQTFAGTPITFGLSTGNISGVTPEEAWALEANQLRLMSQDTPYVMNANPISWSALFKPCSGNGPFGGSYAIRVSSLVLPQGINLLAPSSP